MSTFHIMHCTVYLVLRPTSYFQLPTSRVLHPTWNVLRQTFCKVWSLHILYPSVALDLSVPPTIIHLIFCFILPVSFPYFLHPMSYTAPVKGISISHSTSSFVHLKFDEKSYDLQPTSCFLHNTSCFILQAERSTSFVLRPTSAWSLYT